MASRKRKTDVLILGGGPAGLATAVALAGRGMSVVLVERGGYRDLRIGEHLPPAGIRLLGESGLSTLVDGKIHMRCTGVDAWWGGNDAANHLDYLFHPIGHGVNLSRPRFDASWARASTSAGVQLLTGARLRKAARTRVGWTARVESQRGVAEYRVDLFVDATGRSAVFARSQGSSIRTVDCQVALIALRSSEEAIDEKSGRVLIESTEQGWWYFAPLCERRCVGMFITDVDLLRRAPGSAYSAWEQGLQCTRHVRERLAQYPRQEQFAVRAARSQRLSRFCGDGWLAVGDAAVSFDPLSSQGIAKALEDGANAAEAVMAHLGGDGNALENTAARFATIYSDYEQTRLGYYALERRWLDAPFWRRRQRATPIDQVMVEPNYSLEQ